MYVVIFRAKVKKFDDEYSHMAARMRDLALTEFGCIEFCAVTEGKEEVALSWWPSEESIKAWKMHPEHIEAQRLGRELWYESYSVQVAEVSRTYGGEGKGAQ